MRQRLHRDPYFFACCVAFFGFVTICLAVTWRLFGDPVLLALAIASVGPAFWLFYAREKAALETKQGRRQR